MATIPMVGAVSTNVRAGSTNLTWVGATLQRFRSILVWVRPLRTPYTPSDRQHGARHLRVGALPRTALLLLPEWVQLGRGAKRCCPTSFDAAVNRCCAGAPRFPCLSCHVSCGVLPLGCGVAQIALHPCPEPGSRSISGRHRVDLGVVGARAGVDLGFSLAGFGVDPRWTWGRSGVDFGAIRRQSEVCPGSMWGASGGNALRS